MFIHFLDALRDGTSKHHREIRAKIVKEMNISDEDQHDMIPSGQSTRLANRVGWTRTHLSKAGLVQLNGKGYYQITDEGRELLKNPPSDLNLKFLDTIPAHKKWFRKPRKKKSSSPEQSDPSSEDQPPNERLEAAFDEIKHTLSKELGATLKQTDPYFFENVVVDLLTAMGYGGSKAEAGRVTKASGDGGIDGTIKEDRLGLDIIYIQAKRYQHTVPIAHIRDFAGALLGKRARKGVFITTSDFPQSALDFVGNIDQKIILIDGIRLTELMIEHNIGVSVRETIQIKAIDTDYFEDN